MTVWLNGALVEADAARIDPSDRGFTLGDGLFETVRIDNGRPLWLERHLLRLAKGASVLEMAIPFDATTLAKGFAALLASTGVRDGSARLTLSRGPAPRGLLPHPSGSPTLLITASAGRASQAPASVMLCRCTRRNEASPLSRVKSLSYLDGVLARMEAARRGVDDALLLNGRGQLAEASAATLFVLAAGVLTTPPVTDGALPGILRGLVLERCYAVERSMTPDDLTKAEAAFLTSALGIRPITEIEGRPLRIREDVLTDIRRRTMP